MKYQLLIIFLFNLLNATYSQVNKIDSIEAILPKLSGSAKVDAMIELGYNYHIKNNEEISITTLNSAYDLAKKIGYIKGCVHSLVKITEMLPKTDQKSTNKYCLSIIELAKQSKDKCLIAEAYSNVASIIMFKNPKEALKYLELSLKIYNEINLVQEQIDIALDLSDFYSKTARFIDSSLIDYVKSNYYLEQVLLHKEKLKNKKLIYIWISIGNNYEKLGNLNISLEYFDKAMNLAIEISDIKSQGILFKNYGNISVSKNDYEKALEHYTKAIDIMKKNDKKKSDPSLSLLYDRRGIVLMKLKKYKQSNDDLLYCYNSFNSDYKIINDLMKYHMLTNISINYDSLGNIQEAYKYYKLALQEKDSSDSKKEKIKILEIQGKYDTERKEKEIAILNKDKELQKLELEKNIIAKNEQDKTFLLMKMEKELNESEIKKQKAESDKKSRELQLVNKEKKIKEVQLHQQTILRNSFIIGFILMLILVVVIFRSYRQKRKDNTLLAIQNTEIRQQKEEISAQRDEISAQRDTVVIQKDHMEEQKKEITDSITYAKRIQQAVLPTGEYANKILGDHFILFKPKDIVSGDFYWATKINEWLIVTVADCTGHGVPGAFMSMLGVSFLNEIVRKKEITKASEILDHLRDSIIEALQQRGQFGEQKDGMDIAMCVFNTVTNKLQFAGANNPLYLILNNSNYQLTEIKGDKMPIGIHYKLDCFKNHELQLNKGDIIYLSSDGYRDQFGGENGNKILSKNFKQILTENCNKSMKEQKEILDNIIEDWKNGYETKYEQTDDIAIVGLKV